jgi:translation initiation factor IF-3
MTMARDMGLDLVEVAPSDRPPVCRIMDFGKFKYQQNKKHAKSHSHQSKLKELRVRPSTGQHDIDTKLNQARGFLKHKDKVVFSVIFRGRENAHIEEGFRIANQICTALEDVGKVESSPSQQSKRIIFVIVPKV